MRWIGPLLLLTAPALAGIEVQGHRGARAERPENTLPAFAYALEVGVDVLELDLGVTRDDRLVVLHDRFVNPERCAPVRAPMRVRDHDLATLQTLDCGTAAHPRFPKQTPVPGARIPTLEAVFALAKGHRVGFNIETKLVPGRPADTVSAARFAELVVAAVRAAGMVERTTVQSFDQRTLQAVAKLEPKLRRVLLVSDNLIDHVAAAKAATASVVSPHHEWITAADVARLHAAGLQVIPWTVNTPEGWARMVELGVDGIITDDPGALIPWLRARKLR